LREVNTDFVIWYRAQKNECTIQDMLDSAVANYQNFLDEIADKTKVISISVLLPSIQDGQDWGLLQI
jgi:hypothetical protein